MVFAFGPFELDLGTCELRRGGRNVPLQPRVFGMLRYLIEHRERVVGKQELIDALWGGARLNAVAVPWTINRARKALGDDSDARTFIETVRGHGYRFVAELRTLEERAAPPSEQPFVGRAEVMLRLTAALDAAAEGHGRLCLLSGEAGIGKTRCADELASLARRRGQRVWIGRCFEHGIAPAFWPFIQILRMASADSSLHENLQHELAALLEELEPRAQARPAGSCDDRFWLLDRLSRWLCSSARAQLRVIYLDDLHCADESSLQALSLLAPLLAQARLLVIATVRDSASAAHDRSPSALAARLRPCEQLPLSGLHREDVTRYLDAMLGTSLAVQLSPVLYTKTAGNPLFLHEVSRVVRAQYERNGQVSVEDVPLPAAVTEVIRARLRELPPETRRLLDVACVVGEEFTPAVLQRATGLQASEVLAGLQAAVQVNIVAARPDASKHAFAHPLMREVLYAGLSTPERARLHAHVGVALEALGLIDPPLTALAYHFHHAPLDAYYERAARYGRLAGDAALRALAYEEAVQCYAWALEAQVQSAPDDVAAACELLLISAAAQQLAGRGAEGRKQCQRAIELASAAQLPEMLVAAARQLRPSVWLAHISDPLALQALEQALQLAPESARGTRARAYAQLATLPPYSLRLPSSQRMSAEALRLARESQDEQLEFEAQRSRLFALCGPDSIDEELRVAEELLRQEPERNARSAVDAHFARYHAYMQRGDIAAADLSLDAFGQLGATRHLRIVNWQCERLRAQRLLYAGQLAEAERRFEGLWREAERVRVPLAAAYEIAHRCALNCERTGKRWASPPGELPEGLAWVRRLPAMRVNRVVLLLDLGDERAARQEFHGLAEDDFAAVADYAFSLFALVQLVGPALQLGELAAARTLRALLAPHAGLVALSPFALSHGCVARYVGELESALGHGTQARAYFEQAIEVNGRTAHELERLRAQLALADELSHGRTQRERARARKLVRRVNGTARDLGAVALATSAHALEQRLDGTRSHKPQRPRV